MLRLYTFTISHFSEKARWALDLERVPYEETPLLPGPHMMFTKRHVKRSSVPVLEHDGAFVQGSGAILDYVQERLGGKRLSCADEKRAREIEKLADEAWGLGTQRIFYEKLLDRPRDVADLWLQRGPWWGGLFYKVAFPLVRSRVRRMYKISPDKVAESKDLFRRAFDETDRALAGGAKYLVGDRLSRADIVVAALLAPSCMPKEHVLKWPSELPPDLDAFLSELRSRPTWEFVLRMYRDHRRVDAPLSSAA
ncbi:MAG TPA: glutathione S-transferase [Labilithrix sp.]|jgi:glutathione S-transferase